MVEPSIRCATEADAERCFAVLALACAGDPVMRWTWPDPKRYLDVFPRYARAFSGRALDSGTAYYVEAFSGVALWLPPGTSPDEAALRMIIEDTMQAEVKDAMPSIIEQMDTFHPHEQHWYLPLIGVDPVSQGHGYGSMLLSRALEECARQQVSAYLESTSPRSIPLYERHGFEVRGTIQAGTSPPLFPMLRKPR